MSPIKVLLVDDHQVVREGLRRMLDLEDDISVVGEADSMETALRQAGLRCPDVVLMDIKMPGTDGVETTRRLKEEQPGCSVIILTLYEDYVAEAVGAGAVGYLLKDVRREELCQAIRVAYQGQSPFNPVLARRLVSEFTSLTKDKGKDEPGVSERQTEILRLLASGATNKQIASQLFLSETTVKREMHSIFARLDVSSRSGAVSEAYKRKLI
jgi:DNA-binding NarL/FixJ family response regulator